MESQVIHGEVVAKGARKLHYFNCGSDTTLRCFAKLPGTSRVRHDLFVIESVRGGLRSSRKAQSARLPDRKGGHHSMRSPSSRREIDPKFTSKFHRLAT